MSASQKQSVNAAVENVKVILGRAAEEIVATVSTHLRQGIVEGILAGAAEKLLPSMVNRLAGKAVIAPAPSRGKSKGMPYSKRPMTDADKKRAALHGRYVGLVSHARNEVIKAQAKKIYETDGIDKAIAFLARAKLGKVTVVKAVKNPVVKKPVVKKLVAKKSAAKKTAAKKAAPHKNGASKGFVSKVMNKVKRAAKKTVKATGAAAVAAEAKAS